MNRFYHSVIVLGFFCALTAVFAGGARAQEAAYPSGLAASNVMSGIYPGTDAGNCCWMGPRAVLRIAVPSGADTLLLNVFVPQYAVHGDAQSLRVQINGAKDQERCCFGAGEHELAFAVPANVRGRTVRLNLYTRSTFVPKALGLNEDPRHLSVLVRGMLFFDSASGEIVGGAVEPGLQSAPPVWLAIAGIVILALTLRRPAFGIAALLLTDPFLLGHLIHGTTITLPKVALVAVAAGLIPALWRRKSFPVGTAFWWLLGAQLAFAASMAASSLHASHHGAALRETLKAFEYAVTFALAYVAYRLDPDETIARYAIMASALIVSCAALAQEFTGAPQAETIASHTIARIAGPLEGPNQLSGYLGIVLPVMLAFAVWRPAIILERVAIALACVACVLTFSKSGIAALVLAAALLLLVRYGARWRRYAIAGAAAAFAVLMFLAVGSFAGATHGTAANIFGSADSADSFNGGLGVRSDLWHGAYTIWRAHPYSGIGPGNFEFAVGRFNPGVRTHANSMYFQALAEQGIPGLLALLIVVGASIGVYLRRLSVPLGLGACMAAIALAFHQIVDCMWLYPKVGVMWWLILALGAAAIETSWRLAPSTTPGAQANRQGLCCTYHDHRPPTQSR
jgi:O-antigen ligase